MAVRQDSGWRCDCDYDSYFHLNLTEKLENKFACGYGRVADFRPVKGTFPSA